MTWTPRVLLTLRASMALALLGSPLMAETPDNLTPARCPPKLETSTVLEAECFVFTTREVAGDDRSALLSIPVLRARAKGVKGAPEPVFYLHGGPGSAELVHFEDRMATPPFDRLLAQLGGRTWIFFDHRGVGRSMPPLTCVGKGLQAVRACAAKLQAQGLRLEAYNSVSVAGDMERLRRAFGYTRIHVYGVSYGSRLAHTFGRLYPASTLTLVHDGPMSPDDQETVGDARGAEVALRAVVRDHDPTPENPLWPRFEAGLARLIATPARVADETVTAARALAIVRETLFSGGNDLTATIRAMAAIADGRMDALVEIDREREAAGKRRRGNRPTKVFSGQALSVDCNEEKAFESVEEWKAAQAEHGPVVDAFIMGAFEDEWLEACAAWPSGKAPPVENTFFDLAMPQLVLTGEYDPSMSRTGGAAIARRSRNAREVLFTRTAHVQFGKEKAVCAARIVHAFFDDPAKPLDTGCAAQLVEATAR